MASYPEPSFHGADPDEPDFRTTLHERYRHLREVAPVNLTPRGTWRLTRHADCLRLLKHTKVGVRTTDGVLLGADESTLPRVFMLDQDPPNHGRLRRLVSRYFTPRAMESLATQIETKANELVAAMEDRECDLMEALALPLPSSVICQMLGVPLADRSAFGGWVHDLTYFLLGDAASEEQKARGGAAMQNMIDFVMQLVAERRKTPTDDVIGVLVAAEREGEKLSEAELLWQCIGLIVGGFETTTGVIGMGTRSLLRHRDQWERLRADPALARSTTEECLRYDPPIVAASRVLHEDAQFGDYLLEKNTLVAAVIAAANRDPEVFPDPDRFDVGRQDNPHLTFGNGSHMCLGMHLARLETDAAFRAMAKRLPRLELVDAEIRWSPSLFRIPGPIRVRA